MYSPFQGLSKLEPPPPPLKSRNHSLHKNNSISPLVGPHHKAHQHWFQLRLNILCCVYGQFMLWKMCVLHCSLWAVQTINFQYTQHAMFKRNCNKLYDNPVAWRLWDYRLQRNMQFEYNLSSQFWTWEPGARQYVLWYDSTWGLSHQLVNNFWMGIVYHAVCELATDLWWWVRSQSTGPVLWGIKIIKYLVYISNYIESLVVLAGWLLDMRDFTWGVP